MQSVVAALCGGEDAYALFTGVEVIGGEWRGP